MRYEPSPPRRGLIAAITPKGGFRIVPEDADVRLLLAIGFSTLFAITIVVSLILPFLPGRDSAATWSTLKEVLSVLLPAETGLLGSVLGFYFGSKTNEPIVTTRGDGEHLDIPPIETQ